MAAKDRWQVESGTAVSNSPNKSRLRKKAGNVDCTELVDIVVSALDGAVDVVVSALVDVVDWKASNKSRLRKNTGNVNCTELVDGVVSALFDVDISPPVGAADWNSPKLRLRKNAGNVVPAKIGAVDSIITALVGAVD